MSLKRLFFAALIPFIFSCTPGGASPWRPYTFNGNDYQPSLPEAGRTVWVRSGYMPRLTPPENNAADTGKLPPGTGAVAGICYLQTSGGKLGGDSAIIPYHHEQIMIKSLKEGISVTRTDESGYFMETLFPGDYELSCRGNARPVTVKKGQTSLVPLRGGKRMAD